VKQTTLVQAFSSAADIAEGVLARLRIFPISAQARTARLLEASELFDRAWYRSQNQGAPLAQIAPGLHYLRYGAAQGRDPGPNFNTRKYLETHKDVAVSGINPLVHYVLHGKAENRRISRSSAVPGPVPLATEPQVLASDPPSFSLPETITTPWLKLEELSRDRRFLSLELSGLILARLPASSTGYEAARQTIDAFCKLSGTSPAQPARQDKGAAACPILSFDEASIADVWYVNERVLRVRASSSEPCAIRFFQYDARGATVLRTAGESIFEASALNLADVPLANAFAPLLAILTTPSGDLISASLLPFPSLCRGGAHYAELCATGGEATYMEALRRVSAQLSREYLHKGRAALRAVQLLDDGAIGSEPILRSDIRDWLSRMLQIDLPSPGSEASEGTVVLPTDAIPSLHALLAGSAAFDDHAMHYVLSDRWTWRPRWSVKLPAIYRQIEDLQTRVAPLRHPRIFRREVSEISKQEPAPAVVRFAEMREPDPALMIAPIAREIAEPLLARQLDSSARVSVLVKGGSEFGDAFAACVESIRMQTMAASVEIIMSKEHTGAQAILQRYFPNGYRFVDAPSAEAQGKFVLVVDPSVVLHDARTLHTLCTIAELEEVASAGCLLLQGPQSAFRSAGVFMSSDGLFGEPDCRSVFPCATYPVAANSSAVFAARADVWRDLVGEAATSHDLEYGLRAMAAGLHNLCTSVVTAELHGNAFRAPYVAEAAPLPFDRALVGRMSAILDTLNP
jgi:hypothetical protein